MAARPWWACSILARAERQPSRWTKAAAAGADAGWPTFGGTRQRPPVRSTVVLGVWAEDVWRVAAEDAAPNAADLVRQAFPGRSP